MHTKQSIRLTVCFWVLFLVGLGFELMASLKVGALPFDLSHTSSPVCSGDLGDGVL
jgi:hypothetical protein